MEPVIHGVVLDGTAVITDADKKDISPAPWTVVTLWITGGPRNKAWRKATLDGIAIGDIVAATWTHNERTSDGFEANVFEYLIDREPSTEIVNHCQGVYDAMPPMPAPQPAHQAPQPQHTQPDGDHRPPPPPMGNDESLRRRVSYLGDAIRNGPTELQTSARTYCQSFRINLNHPYVVEEQHIIHLEALLGQYTYAPNEEPF